VFELNGHINASVGKCANRIAWIRHGDRLVVMLADGAGNHAGAGFAAEFAIRNAMKFAGREKQPLQAAQWLNIVQEIDEPLSMEPSGETTLVVADIGRDRISGAGIGDSKTFILSDGLTDLTAKQQRAPLLGSGGAVAREYESGWGDGIVLICNDGLHKYAAREKLVAGAQGLDAAALIELARLPNGTLFDDAGCVLVRRGKTTTLPEGTIQHIQSS